MPSDPQQQSPKFYLTTPIYYVNARPHIGSAYTTLVADVLARRHRLLGHDTFFLTGTDEHGQKIERSAAAAGIPPQQFVDEVAQNFQSLWDRMGLNYDRFIRTTDPVHKRGAQKLFTDLYDRGAIYLSSYTGQYCVSEEIFVEGPPGTIGPDGKPTETVTEENFFFRLSDYQRPLLDLIESDTLHITPEVRKNEVLSFLRGNTTEPGTTLAHTNAGTPYVPGALRDLSVSRSSFSWGIPVPQAIQERAGAAENHVMYVWLDALTNYMTAVGYGSDDPEDQAQYQRYWPADLHLMGKEITRQHCIYWPAFLLAADLPMPRVVTAHGWLLFDNAKMSKSKGNIVRAETILDAFGDQVYGKQFPDSTKRERDLFATDVLRYFLLREIPFGQDGSFSFDALITRYNADLANGYGNLVSRVLKLVEQHFPDGWVEPEVPWLYPEPDYDNATDLEVQTSSFFVWDEALDCVEIVADQGWPEYRFNFVITEIMRRVGYVDSYLTFHKPWTLAKSNEPHDRRRLTEVLYVASEAIRLITLALHPLMPATTAKVWLQLGLGDIQQSAGRGDLALERWLSVNARYPLPQQPESNLKPGTKLGPLSPIFPRADKSLAQVMIDMEESRNITPRPEAPLAAATTPTAPSAPPPSSSHPAAPPRTSSSDPAAEHTGTLTVGGSTAQTPSLPTTPGSHTEAPASGVFNNPAATASETPQTINIDDFMKVELRVAQILVAERIPKADKLLRLEVDLGTEKRQILSGIAQHYTPEELIGRRIVVVSNLAPRKMRGLDSHGMLLAASEGPEGKPILATFGEDIALGSRVR